MFHLQHVGNHVAVREHGAFGNAGRAAGVLQKGQIFRADIGGWQRLAGTQFQRFVELDGTRQAERRHSLVPILDHEIDDQRFREAQHVTDGRGDDLLDLGLANHFLQRLGEVLEDHDG